MRGGLMGLLTCMVAWAGASCSLLFTPDESADACGSGEKCAAGEVCHCGRCAVRDTACARSGLSYVGAGSCVSAPTQLSGGVAHTCVRLDDGSAFCWGSNDSGELGNQPELSDLDIDNRFEPVQVLAEGGAPLSGVQRVAVGANYSCAIVADGAVVCWGSNFPGGELGSGTPWDELLYSLVPLPVVDELGEPLSRFSELSLFGFHACAAQSIFIGGRLACWGRNEYQQLGAPATPQVPHAVVIPGNASQVTVGIDHTCFVNGGRPLCLGRDQLGQLGNGVEDISETCPSEVEQSRSEPDEVLGANDLPLAPASRIAGGHGFGCAIRTSPSGVFCWGANAFHALGEGTGTEPAGGCDAVSATDGPTRCSAVPVAVPAPVSGDDLSLGKDFGCALLDGAIWCWGNNDSGQLGTGTNLCWQHPSPVADPPDESRWIQVAAGWHHACAIDSQGRVYCWGKNDRGQLGLGHYSNRDQPTELGPFCP